MRWFRPKKQPEEVDYIAMCLLVAAIAALIIFGAQCSPVIVKRQYGLNERVVAPDKYRRCSVLDSIVEVNKAGGVKKLVWFECR